MATRKLEVQIVGDASSLQKALGNAGNSSSSLGSKLKSLGKVAAVGVGAAFVGMAAVVKNGFGELAEGQQVTAQTNAALKSTGQVAKVTAKEIDALAQSISKKTGIDDEAVQASENMLLTFTKIRNEAGKNNDIFNQTTQAVADMATRMNNGAVPSMEQLSTTSIRVGKALNDPVKGVGALSRVGVQFTEDQKKMISEMVKSGDVMGAQKLILRELTTEFGGSAKAAGETLPGQMAKLRNSFDEASGAIATTLLPHLQKFLDWANEHMPQIQAAIQGGVTAIAATIEFLAPIITKIIEGFRIMAAFVRKHWDEVQAAAQRVVAWYQGTLAPAINTVLTAIKAYWDRFGADILKVALTVFNQIRTIVTTVMGNIASVINIILAILRGDWSKAWEELKEIPRRTLSAVVSLLRGMVSIFSTVAKALGAAIIDGIVAGLAALAAKVGQAMQAIQTAITQTASAAAGWAARIGEAIVRGIVSGMSGLLASVKDKIIGGVQGAIDGAMGIFGNSPQEVIGIALIDGIVRGWNDRMSKGGLKEKMVEGVNAAIDAAQQAVTSRQGAFAAAFDGLISGALAAFDKLTSQFETKTERLIRKQDEARANAERQGALTAAQGQLAAAVTPEEIKAAEQALADALFAIQRARDEKIAAQERKEYEAKRERQRTNFERRLEDLKQAFLNQEITTAEFNQRLIALFKRFEIPFQKATNKLGFALATGLRESFDEVRRAARGLAQEVLAAFEGITIRIRTELQHTDSPGRQHGGPVVRGQSYVVGEAGPELFIPNQSGRIVAGAVSGGSGVGGMNVALNFYGPTAGTSREFEDTVRRALYDVQRRNPGTGL